MSGLASGMSVGMVVGPVAAGGIIDSFGPIAGFDLTAAFGLGVVALVTCCIPLLRKWL